MYASQKVQFFFLVLQARNTFQARAGPPQAGASTGSINIFQSPIIAVNEVEHQKTVNTEHGKQTIWFSEVIKVFYNYFQAEKLEDTKR